MIYIENISVTKKALVWAFFVTTKNLNFVVVTVLQAPF